MICRCARPSMVTVIWSWFYLKTLFASIRSSYSEKTLYEKKIIDYLWTHYYSYCFPHPTNTFSVRLGKKYQLNLIKGFVSLVERGFVSNVDMTMIWNPSLNNYLFLILFRENFLWKDEKKNSMIYAPSLPSRFLLNKKLR